MFVRCFGRCVASLLTLGYVVLIGCSSQSGNSTDSGNTGPSEIVQTQLPNIVFNVQYDGISTPAAVKASNANKFFSVAWGDSASLPPLIEHSSPPVRMGANTIPSNRPMLNRTLFHATLQARVAQRAATAAVTTTSTTPGVVSGTMTVSGARNVDGTGLVTLTYNAFSDGDGAVYDGQVFQLIRAYDRDIQLATDASMAISALKITTAAGTYTISGYYDEKVNIESMFSSVTLNLTGINESSNEKFRYQDFIAKLYYSESGNAVSLMLTGRVFLAAHGYADVSTTVPLACFDCSDAYPDLGGPVLLSGANQSRAKVTPRSATRVRIDFDEDGDLVYENFALYLWDDLAGNAVPNHAPSVAAISVVPQTAYVDSDLSIVAITPTDIDGDTLTQTYQWLKNGIAIENATQSSLPAGTFAKHNVIEARLIASDGIDSAQQSTLLTIQNSIPVVQAPAFSTDKVFVTDTIQVSAPIATDTDGDALTYNYSWTVNGSTVVSATRSSLQLSKFKKGDSVIAIVSVSDGDDTVHVSTLPLTISDSPPVFTMVPPSVATYSSLVTFSATAIDVDLDPIQFSLVFGPTNMTVAANGAVNWSPDLPMFGKAVDVHFGIKATSAGLSTDFDGSIQVRDNARNLPLVRTGLAYGSSSARIADFDGDGTSEILLAGRSTLNALQKDASGNYVQNWVYPFTDFTSDTQGPYIGSLLFDVADITGDKRLDIAVTMGSDILLIDGATKHPLSRLVNTDNQVVCIKIADLEKNGLLDLVVFYTNVVQSTSIAVYNAKTLAIKWKVDLGTAFVLNNDHNMSIANVDNDAALEIVTATGHVIDGKTHAIEWSYSSEFGFAIDTGDLDGNGVNEIVGLLNSPGRARVYNAAQKTTGGTYSKPPYWDVRTLLVSDLNGDGKSEIVTGELGETGSNGYVRAYSYNTSSGQFSSLWAVDSHGDETVALAVGDTDKDGNPELVWTGGGPIVVTSATVPASIKWVNEESSPAWFGKITSFVTDGPYFGGKQISSNLANPQLIFFSGSTNGGYDPGRSIVLDPIKGTTIIGKQIDPQAFPIATGDVFDANGDGNLDVVVGVQTNTGAYISTLDPYTTALTPLVFLNDSQVRHIQHADINKDGRDELYFLGSDSWGATAVTLNVFNTSTLKAVWKNAPDYNFNEYFGDELHVDVNGDGYSDWLVGSPTQLSWYLNNKGSGFTAGPQTSAPVEFFTRALAQVKISANAAPKIITVMEDGTCSYASSYSARSEVHVLEPQTLALISKFTTDICIQAVIPTPNMGRQNILVGFASTLAELDPVSGKVIWESPKLIGSVVRGSLRFMDVYNDGKPHLIFGTKEGMYVTR